MARTSLLKRIGAGLTAFAEPERPPTSSLTREIGIPGGLVQDGLTISSYNPNLSGAEWFATVEEMVTSFSQAGVVELCVTLPIVSAEWTVEGGSTELNELVKTSLFGARGMSTTWKEVLHNACQSALYGTAVFEIIWKELDGALAVRRLMDRDPSSVDSYEFDADGGLKAILQKGADPDTSESVEATIPIEKCLLFPYRLRRRQYHGRSILRPAYRHYESVNMLCTFADIGLDHSLVGVPVGKAPPHARPEDHDTFRQLISAIRRHEASGLVMPSGWDLVDGRIIGGSDTVGFLDYLHWHEGCFLRSALCGFMQLGSTDTGSYALGEALMEFSLMSWGALAEMIAGVVNRHLVRRICDYNAGGELAEDDYPKLVVQPIREVFGSTKEAGSFLSAVANQDEALPEDPGEREEAMREGLRLPDGDTRSEGAPASHHGDTMPHSVPANRRKTFSEADVQAAVARVKADGAEARDAWQSEMTPRLEALLSNLLRQVDAADGDPERLAEATPAPALVDDLAAGITRFVADVRRLAAERMAEELNLTGDTLPQSVPLDPEPTAAELAKGRNLADHLVESARFAVVGGALRGEDLTELASAFSETLDVRLRNDLTDAARAVTAGVNDGG